MYLVIVNRGEHSGFITEVHHHEWCSPENPDGLTEQQVSGPHGWIVGEYETREAADAELARNLTCDSVLKGTYCYTHNPFPIR